MISNPNNIKIGVPKTNIPIPAIVWKVERIIINLEKVVIPTPSSPFKKTMSPIFRFLQNFIASNSNLEISKI